MQTKENFYVSGKRKEKGKGKIKNSHSELRFHTTCEPNKSAV